MISERKWRKHEMATTITRRRAKKGGEVSPVNGKFYKGGWFMPDKIDGGGADKPKKKTGKIEVAPYVWEVPPTPEHRSIFRCFHDYFDPDGNYIAEAIRFAAQMAGITYGKMLMQAHIAKAKYEKGFKFFREDENGKLHFV